MSGPLAGHLSGVLRPEAWHGAGRPPPFFEGWYFKLVDEDGLDAIALIPGIHLAPPPAPSQAFVQVLDARERRAFHARFAPEAFEASRRRLAIHVGECSFTDAGVELDLEREGLSLRGQVTFSPLSPWPVTLRRPGAMGWYGWVPTMECYHGVLSLDHALHGELELNGRRISFHGGRGYIETDWGRRFPEIWIWIQSNHFHTTGTSVMVSLARIPWRGSTFPGLIAGLRHRGRLYAFATWNGARLERLEVDDERVTLAVRRGRRRLLVRATRGPAVPILGPSPQGMDVEVRECLGAAVDVRLTETGVLGERVIFEGAGLYAGLEVHGEVGRLGPE